MDNGPSDVLEAPPDESLNIQALQDKALQLWEVDKTSALELGRALVAVRDAMQSHGDFAQWWRDAGMEEKRVYYCVRVAEGKIKPKALPAEPICLTKHNLVLARGAKAVKNVLEKAVIHVGPNGTTATDGFIVSRVSLPPKSPTQQSGLLPADFALGVLANWGKHQRATEITFGKDKVSAVADDLTLTTPIALGAFPALEHPWLQANAPVVYTFGLPMDRLRKLLDVLSAFVGEDHTYTQVRLSALRTDASGAPLTIRVDAQRDGQTFLAITHCDGEIKGETPTVEATKMAEVAA